MSFGALGFQLPANINLGNKESVYRTNDVNNSSIQRGGSWLEDILNTVVKVSDINANKRIQQARAQSSTDAGYYIDETALGIDRTQTQPTTQGAAAGAAVGSFADKAVNFAKQNWLILAGGGALFLAYKTTPKSARNGARRRRRSRR